MDLILNLIEMLIPFLITLVVALSYLSPVIVIIFLYLLFQGKQSSTAEKNLIPNTPSSSQQSELEKLIQSGIVALRRRNYKEAIQNLEEARSRSTKNQELDKIALCSLLLADINQPSREYERAYLKDALRIYRYLGNEEGAAYIHKKLGIFDLLNGSSNSAHKNLKAVEHYYQVSDHQENLTLVRESLKIIEEVTSDKNQNVKSKSP